MTNFFRNKSQPFIVFYLQIINPGYDLSFFSVSGIFEIVFCCFFFVFAFIEDGCNVFQFQMCALFMENV